MTRGRDVGFWAALHNSTENSAVLSLPRQLGGPYPTATASLIALFTSVLTCRQLSLGHPRITTPQIL